MEEILENLDSSMKILYLILTIYDEISIDNKLLDALYHQYQAFELCLSKYNETYSLKYSNMSEIQSLLVDAGYIEKPKSK